MSEVPLFGRGEREGAGARERESVRESVGESEREKGWARTSHSEVPDVVQRQRDPLPERESLLPAARHLQYSCVISREVIIEVIGKFLSE